MSIGETFVSLSICYKNVITFLPPYGATEKIKGKCLLL